MNRKLTLGSLFDGSGGFPLGGLISGITPVWASEIEPFPIRVTTKRLPFMKHYGDISQMDGGKVEPVDIICFGSPCTDMSVAGRRAGLDGKQSVLFYQAIRIITEMRCATNGKYPRWICWENVPGAFSSNSGQDFKAVLEAVIGVVEPDAQVPMPEKGGWPYADCYMGDGWSVAYRTLDAQYWGVPQRRRRIYLVADFDGRSAADVLFKSEGVSGYSAESFRAWQGITGGAACCSGTAGISLDGYNGSVSPVASTLGVNCGMSTGRNGVVLNDQGGNRMDVTHEVTCTLRAEAHHPPVVMDEPAVFENHSQDTRYTGPLDVAPTVSHQYGTGGNNQPFVVSKDIPFCKGTRPHSATEGQTWKAADVANTLNVFDQGEGRCNELVVKAFGISSYDSNAMKSSNPHSGIYEADTSRTIDGNGGNPGCNQGGVAVVCVDQSCEPVMCIQGSMIGRKDSNGPQGDGINEEVSFTLNTVDRHAVYAMTAGCYTRIGHELVPPLMARDYKDPPLINTTQTASGKDVIGTLSASMGSKQWLGNQEAFTGDYHIVSPNYSVRRLTPTECARLQGFPDWWCDGLDLEDPTEEDITFWTQVWETHRRIVSPATKPKTRNQIVKWLKHPHSDAAEYKMWGNGVALPCVCFVLAGIAYADGLSPASE